MKLNTAVSVFCCLLQRAVAQVDISGCCTHVKIETTGEASIHQGNRIGEYRLTGVLAERPIYKNTEREEFLFYLQSKNKGLWMVGPTAGQFNGGLAHRGDTYCVEDVPVNQWKYTDGSAWHVDPLLRVSCLDQSVTPQCLYNDQTEFVGGDLPEVFGGGGVETSMESSADCIEECEKRSGCNYWTWVMGEKVNCFLKNRKVDTVRKPKHVSGSIPKACASTPPTPTQSPSTYSVCTYNSLDFQGGDLFSVLANDVDDCRQQCEDHVSCQLFTFDKGLERGCYFKTDQVKVTTNENVVSGATAEICEDFILPHVTKNDEESTYNENEVNGKFKITSLRWDEKLSNPNSQEYLDLSNTIEDSLESMLRSERDLDEQAEFSVKVQKFRQGSVVCDFKVNYILKEAYIAIPFAIKPSNITDAMNKNFKFKKGILFQRFLIAAGSFNSSAPVDHCAAKGCSHKCDYDYDVEDYLCTCPRSLVLDQNEKKCISPEEAATEKTVDGITDETEAEEDVATILPEVKLTLLPTACLWSPWSDWTACSSSCGTGKKERQRTVVLPAKNGGACPGRFKEFVECSVECDGEEQNVVTESNDRLEDIATGIDEQGVSESGNNDELTTVSASEDENEDTAEAVSVSFIADGTEDDEEETVTEVVSTDNADDGSELDHDYKQTTMSFSDDEEEGIVVDAVTESVRGDEEVLTVDVGNDEQTTIPVNEDESEDSFGRRIPQETTESQEPAEDITESSMVVSDQETTTKDNIELTTDASEETILDEEEPETDIKNEDIEDQKIVFPLIEDVEIIPTTEAYTSNSLTTLKDTQNIENDDVKDIKVTEIATVTATPDEMNDNTDLPDFSIDNPQEDIGEDVQITQEMTTISSDNKPRENEESETVNDYTTTSSKDNENTTYSPEEEEDNYEEIVTEKNSLQEADPEKTVIKDLNNEDGESARDLGITQSETTTQSAHETETEKTLESETVPTKGTVVEDFVTDIDTEYETTTYIDTDEAQVSLENSVTELTLPSDIFSEVEVTTNNLQEMKDTSTPETVTSPVDEDSRAEEEGVEDETETTPGKIVVLDKVWQFYNSSQL